MTQPTQDPWGSNSQTPNQPQQPSQSNFPQPGYGQPPQPPAYPQQSQQPPVYYQPPQPPGYPQQQSQGLWNPSGVYGGVPVKKPGMPAWGWVLVVMAALVIIGAVASAGKSTTSTTTTSSVQVVATAAPAVDNNSNQVNATATAYAAKVYANLTAGAVSQQTTSAPLAQPTKTALASPSTPAPPVSKSKDIGVKVAGPGQELVGQGGVDNDLKITITSVDRFSQLTDYGGKIVKSQGVFLILSFDMENIGTEPHGYVSLGLIDGNGRKFSTSSNLDAVSAAAFSGNYKSDGSIQPSFKGKDYSIFEVPAEASNFKLKLGF